MSDFEPVLVGLTTLYHRHDGPVRSVHCAACEITSLRVDLAFAHDVAATHEVEVARLRDEVERLTDLCYAPFDAEKIEAVVLAAVGPASARTFRRVVQDLKRERDEALQREQEALAHVRRLQADLLRHTDEYARALKAEQEALAQVASVVARLRKSFGVCFTPETRRAWLEELDDIVTTVPARASALLVLAEDTRVLLENVDLRLLGEEGPDGEAAQAAVHKLYEDYASWKGEPDAPQGS